MSAVGADPVGPVDTADPVGPVDTADPDGPEDLEDYRHRSRRWLARNMPRSDGASAGDIDDGEARWKRARELQALLFEGGFAGICYPRRYGGQGLSPEHQEVFNDESRAYQMPVLLNIPTLAICAPTILELGTEEQKCRHITAVLRGDEVLVEFLSEPHSGSDLAGARTRADWDGRRWVLNGSKVWTSSAYVGDYALCLARTDWSVPKHQGLTMFLVPVRHPAITIRRIRQVNGNSEFCEEFFDDVELAPDDVLGEVNGGWTVASHRFYYSRTALGGGNPYISGDHDLSVARSRGIAVARSPELLALARRLTGSGQPVPDAVVDAFVSETVLDQLAQRITGAIGAGLMEHEAASMLRLFHAETDWQCVDAGLSIAGSYAVTGPSADQPGAGAFGQGYLFRQATSLGGGSTEMARNVISERVLKMPRELAADVKVPFRDVLNHTEALDA